MIVHVVGAGLIGTSIGLALRGTADVLLSDPVPSHVDTAIKRGAGRAWDGQITADLLVACVPPAAIPLVITQAVRQSLASTYSHVASVQARVQVDLEALGADLSVVCGGHPLAGKERSGPSAASARLFVGRPWVVCPSASTSPAAQRAVRDLALACGAVPVEATVESHDSAVALVSHLPQVAASALAARLLESDPAAALPPLQLAGPGVQDATRIAASDPDLWVDVLVGNARHVAPLVRALAADLARVADALALLGDPTDPGAGAGAGTVAATAAVRDVLVRGNEGRARLPVKPGGADVSAVAVSVVDEPGQLAALLTAAAAAGVNVEDVRVEHLRGRPRGLVELLVRADQAHRARRALGRAGWDVVDGEPGAEDHPGDDGAGRRPDEPVVG